jgi:hypothetical protein
MEAAEQAVNGALYREGDLVGSPRHPMMLAASRRSSDESTQREVLELVDATPGREPVASGATKGIQAMLQIKR